MNGQAEDLGAGPLGVRKTSGPKAHATLIRGLEMHRHGVVDQGAEPTFLQKGPEFVAARTAHHELVIDVMRAFPGSGRDQPRPNQALDVGCCELPAGCVLRLEVAELHPHDGGLNLVQP